MSLAVLIWGALTSLAVVALDLADFWTTLNCPASAGRFWTYERRGLLRSIGGLAALNHFTMQSKPPQSRCRFNLPEMRNYAHFEHLISFRSLACFLASPVLDAPSACAALFSAQRRFLSSCLTPDRHGTRAAALEKMAGRRGGHIFSETHAPTGRRILDFVEQAARFSSSQHNN
jgi:hypothetical protein